MKPRDVKRWDPTTWPVKTVIQAGKRGTRAEVIEFGAMLLNVRHRYLGNRKVKTVEIMLGPPVQVRQRR